MEPGSLMSATRLVFLCLLIAQLSVRVEVTPIIGGRIVQTTGANTPPYPYMVSLQDVISSNNSLEYRHFCGGSLIQSKWILTAAHCVWRKQLPEVAAVIGQEDISNVPEVNHMGVEHVEYIHFQPITYQNDIALIRLKTSVGSEKAVGLLPHYGMKANRKRPCKIIGYGATQHAGQIQNNLIEAEVYVISNAQCREILGHIWAPRKGENTVCALGVNQDSCQGDSGGPLICEYDDRQFIYGIVSHGPICGIKGTPSIYTVTLPYYEWIQLIVNN